MKRFSKTTILALVFLAGIQTLAGQNIRGRVTDASSDPVQPLAGASVYWAGTNIGVATDDAGYYTITPAKGYDRLVASYVGFISDTLKIGPSQRQADFGLRSDEIETVVVSARNRGTSARMDGILTSEVISFAGLTKMACCNLAESFENSASVTVGYSDAITGTRQIKMLGIAGVYTQLLDETRPIMRGIGAPYALGYIPGMWLESIQVSKGVSSVTAGHEAISGQINLEHRKPDADRPLFINLYVDTDARTELNYYSADRINDKLSNILLVHGSIDPLRQDHNHDTFMDHPVNRQINIANRWLWTPSNGMQLRAGVKYVNEHKLSGQTDFEPFTNRRVITTSHINEPWGSEISNQLINGYVKLAIPAGKFVFNEETQTAERSNFALIADYNYFDTDSYYGLFKEYRANQSSVFANAMYSWHIDSRNRLITGISGTMDRSNQYLLTGQLVGVTPDGHIIRYDNGGFETLQTDSEIGAYAEYNYNYKDKLSIVAGMRADFWFQPRKEGPLRDRSQMIYTPRAHIKWNITPRLVLRGSAGMGSRAANLISDNLWVLATGRMFRLENGELSDLNALDRIEESFTYGGSLMWTFRLGNDDSASLSADYFHTEFRNQVIADQEYDTRWVNFYNMDGPSYSDVWQADFNWSPFTNFDVFVTFRYNKTRVTLLTSAVGSDGEHVRRTIEKPLTSRYKGIVNLQYATKFRRWVFDFTAQVNGPSRIPTQTGNLDDSTYSEVYPMFYAQVTWKASPKIDMYIGCENIADYMQDHPIVMGGNATYPDNPHFPEFNSSLIWGPLMGRKVYLGVRMNF